MIHEILGRRLAAPGPPRAASSQPPAAETVPDSNDQVVAGRSPAPTPASPRRHLGTRLLQAGAVAAAAASLALATPMAGSAVMLAQAPGGTPVAHVATAATTSKGSPEAVAGTKGGGPEAFPSEVPSPTQSGQPTVPFDIGPVPPATPHTNLTLKLGQPTSTTIGPGFAGLSYETFTLMQDPHYFTPQNHQLINLFKAMGIKEIRVGGDTVDYMKASPTTPEIDNLFKFAQQVPGLKIIYSLRMINGNPQQEAQTAAHIWKNYPNQLESFAVGNEPNLLNWFHDSHVHSYGTYVNRWLQFAEAIQKAAPGAPISGPDTAGNSHYPGGSSTWDFNFVHDVEQHGIHLASVNTHDYVDGFPKKTSALAVQDMLAPWANSHEQSYDANVARPLEKMGLRVVMTEDNDELIGNPSASDAMAGTLFTMNNLYELADGGLQHADFHNLPSDTRAIYEKPNGTFEVNPKAEAIAAFNRFAQGRVTPVSLGNPQHLNLQAYAVTHAGGSVTVALINDSYGPGGKAASVALAAPHGATLTYLSAPQDNVEASRGVTLGGAQINSATSQLNIKSAPVRAGAHGQMTIEVPPASVAFVTLPG